MDVPGAVEQITLLKRDVAQTRDDVKQVVALIGFVCETLCPRNAALRDELFGRIQDELMDEQQRPNRRAIRAKVYIEGLEDIAHRLEKMQS